MSDQTFTAEEIALAVMNYSEGCLSGKEDFLRNALGITPPNMKRTVTVSVTVEIPTFDDNGTRNNDDHVSAAIRSVLRDYESEMAEHLDSSENGVSLLYVNTSGVTE